MPMGRPELAQQFERALRQGHVTVAVAFAGPDVQEHAFGVDVANLQLEGFTQAQAAGIDRGQGDAVVQSPHPGENAAYLGGRENDWQLELGCGTRKLQLGRPGALERFLPEEFDGAQDLGGALAGEAPFGLEINEILTELLRADQLGRAVEVVSQLAHTGPIALLTARLEREQRQVIGEAFQDCVGVTFFICIGQLQLILTVCRAELHGEPSAACGNFD